MGYYVYLSVINNKLYNKTTYIVFHSWLDHLIKRNNEHPHDTFFILECKKRLLQIEEHLCSFSASIYGY